MRPSGAPTYSRDDLTRAIAASEPTVVDPRGDDVRRAAIALIVRPEPADLSLLFVRRAEVEGDPWSGHMALPGGHMDPGDRDSVETARRETEEEIGVALGREAFLGRLDDIHPMSGGLPSIVVTPHVAWTEAELRIRTNHELQYHLWVPLSALRDPTNRSELRLGRHGRDRVYPSILYEGDTIWGLTHRVVENFLEILDGP